MVFFLLAALSNGNTGRMGSEGELEMQWEASINAMPSVQLDENVPWRLGVSFMQLLGVEKLWHGTAAVLCKALKTMERMNRIRGSCSLAVMAGYSGKRQMCE